MNTAICPSICPHLPYQGQMGQMRTDEKHASAQYVSAVQTPFRGRWDRYFQVSLYTRIRKPVTCRFIERIATYALSGNQFPGLSALSVPKSVVTCQKAVFRPARRFGGLANVAVVR